MALNPVWPQDGSTPYGDVLRNALDQIVYAVNNIEVDVDWKGAIQSGTDLDDVTDPGRYWTGSSHSTGLGTLLVAFSGGSVIQQDAFTANGRWLHRTRDSSGWTDWRRLDNGRSDTLSSSIDVDTLTDPTAWVFHTTTGTIADNHLPEDGFRGHIVVRGSAGYNWQTALSMDNGDRWERTRIGTSSPWSEWRKAAWADKPDMSVRHAMIRDRHAAAIGAPVEVDTATPVAFVWDDWPALMRDLGIVTMAEANEIPITYAIPSRALQAPYDAILGGIGITWPEIDQWVQDGWVELANHSATHTTVLPASSMHDEIVTSLEELQAHSPTKPITSWVMPTVEWEGFNSGATPDEWAGEAGQLILGHHAYATGKMEVLDYRTQPMTGTPIQGQDRIWVEAADLTTSSRQGLITRHYGTNRGVIISAHANNIGKTGRWTVAEVAAFFEWIAAERDAGRIAPMFLSEWAWSRVGA